MGDGKKALEAVLIMFLSFFGTSGAIMLIVGFLYLIGVIK